MKKFLMIFLMIIVFCFVVAACSNESTQSGAESSPSGKTPAPSTSAGNTSGSAVTPAPATPTAEPQAEALVYITVKDLIYTSVVSIEYNGEAETWYKELLPDVELDLDEMDLTINVPNGSESEIKAVLQENAPYKITGWSGDFTSDSEVIKFTPASNSVHLTIEVEPLFEENVALDSEVKCSVSTVEAAASRWGLAFLTDGDLNKRFTTDTIPDVDPDTLELAEPITIDVDMGEAKEFNTILLFPRTDALDIEGGVPNYPFEFDILVSSDGTNYTSVQTVKLEENVNDMVQSYKIGDQNAQYIRLSVKVLGNIAGDEGTAAVPYRIQFTELMAVKVS